MDINERLDTPLFTIHLSIREMKEITMLLGERNADLVEELKMYLALPLSDEKEAEAETETEAETEVEAETEAESE